MIKQYIKKKIKIACGLLNTHLSRGGDYSSEWWDNYFYVNGVSDKRTISPHTNELVADYHYASVEMHILKYFINNKVDLNQSNILDIGSGAGHWIDFYLKMNPCEITGIDISCSSVKHLIKKYKKNNNINIYHGNALKIMNELNDNFDCINAVGIMFHVVDDSECVNLIKSIGNILNPGGMFIVGGHFGGVNGINVQIDNHGVNKRLRSKRWWINVLKESGFKDIKIYKNNAYLWVDDSIPENNILIATK